MYIIIYPVYIYTYILGKILKIKLSRCMIIIYYVPLVTPVFVISVNKMNNIEKKLLYVNQKMWHLR